MKVALKQSAMPTSPTANQDLTDGIFASDVRVFLPYFTRGITNNTIADHGTFSIGEMAGANQFSLGHHDVDNQGTATVVKQAISTARIAALKNGAGAGTVDAEGVGSILSTGGRIAWSDWNANELINALILGGVDVRASLCSGTLNGITDVAITHGLGATPDIIIAKTIGRDAVGTGGSNISIGFYNRVGNTYAAVTSRNGDNATPTVLAQIVHTDCVASVISNTAVDYKITLNDIGATTFDMVASAATPNAPTTPPIVYFLCLQILGGAYKVGTFTTRTTTGTQADITGMSAKPKAVIYLPTFMTALDTHTNATSSESTGFGAAVDNAGVTEQGAIAKWGDDAVTLGVTDAKCLTSNTKAGLIFDGAGALAVDWSISSWNSGGVTNNYSTADATGRQVAYLALADDPAFQVVTVDVPWGATEQSILDGASPAAVDGDIIRCSVSTSPGGYAIQMDADGVAAFDPGTDNSRQSMVGHFWDMSLAAFSDASPITFWFNNGKPVFIGSTDSILRRRNVAITAIPLDPRWSDQEADALDITFQTALPTGLSEVADELIGTPTVYGRTVVTERATDITGDYTERSTTIEIGDLVADVSGMTQAAATTAVTAVASMTLTATYAYSASIATGLTISQSPVASLLSPHDQVVAVVFSLGTVPSLVGRWTGTTAAAAQTAAASGVNVLMMVLFADLDFVGDHTYVSNAGVNLKWGGQTWEGVGLMGDVDRIQESVEVISQPVVLTLSGVTTDFIAAARDTKYKGRTVILHLGLLDPNTVRLVHTEEVWRGSMDVMTIEVQKGEGKIKLVCEHKLRRQPTLYRLSSVDQKALNAGDTFFDHTHKIPGSRGKWGSKDIGFGGGGGTGPAPLNPTRVK